MASLMAGGTGVVAPGSHHRAVFSVSHGSNNAGDALDGAVANGGSHTSSSAVPNCGGVRADGFARACNDPEAGEAGSGSSSAKVRACDCRICCSGRGGRCEAWWPGANGSQLASVGARPVRARCTGSQIYSRWWRHQSSCGCRTFKPGTGCTWTRTHAPRACSGFTTRLCVPRQRD